MTAGAIRRFLGIRNPPGGERNSVELRKLAAETEKLAAESRAVAEKLATELSRLDAETAKFRADKAKLDLEIDKLEVDRRRSRSLYVLEWIKGVGTSATLVAAVVALFGFWNTVRTGQHQREDEVKKRVDTEFTAAAQGLVDADDGKRAVGVLSLGRFLAPSYPEYHDRAAEILAARLRMERDHGARSLITSALVRFGPRALPLLGPVRAQVQRELIPLYDERPLPTARIDVLQQAFLHASLSIAAITSRPADLSHGPLKGIRLQHHQLPGADLSEASLWKGDLYRAGLADARLYRTILRNAILRRVDLSRADLTDADLVCADLWQTDLRTARNIPFKKMAHSTWREAVLSPDTQGQLNSLYPAPGGSAVDRTTNCRSDVIEGKP